MAPKTQDRYAVVCEGLWLNDTKPTDWNQQFPWKPNLSFYYFRLDQNWQAVGEVQKCWIKGEKNMWLFQAMGGSQGKGRYYEVEAESGIMKQEGKPDKPYTTITPLAELFRDGTDRMLRPPVDNKVNTPAPAAKSAPVPPGAVTPPPGAVPAAPKTSSTAATAPPSGGIPSSEPPPPEKKKQGPRPKPSEKFMNACFIPESSQFWMMKDGFAEDGFILNQAHDLAVKMALSRIGWKNQKVWLAMQEGSAVPAEGIGELPVAPLAFAPPEEYQEEYQRWVHYFERDLSERRWTKVAQRLEALLANCTQPDQVMSLVDRAWAMLPQHHYDPLRTRAREVLEALKPDKQQPPPWVGKRTATPMVTAAGTEPSPSTLPRDPEEAPSEPARGVNTPSPGPDPKEVDWAVKSIAKYEDFQKLLAFWSTTKPILQQCEAVRQAFRLWIADRFMKATYQADVDGLREKVPSGILNEELEKTLHARYADLVAF